MDASGIGADFTMEAGRRHFVAGESPYCQLIKEFGNQTGVPVVMCTSFNLRGEAIVCAPTDAVRTFFSSGMDALVIGSFAVEK